MKDKITIAIYLDENGDMDEAFFIIKDETDMSLLDEDIATSYSINFEKEELIIPLLKTEDYDYNGEYFIKIKKAVLTKEQFYSAEPYEY